MAFPVTLNGRTYTLADFSGTNYVEGFPAALEDFVTQAGNIYTTTSTSSVAIGTGSKTFTVADSGKPYTVGTPLRIADAAAPATNWIDGIVTSYSGTTLVVNAIAYAGSGTKASWNINIGGGPIAYTGTLPIAQGGTGATTAADARTNLGLGSAATSAATDFVEKTSATGSAIVPTGSDAQRDGTPSAGYFRFNTDSSSFEGYDGTAWGAVGGSVDLSAVDQDILPDADSARDIGSTSARWAQGWFDDVTLTNLNGNPIATAGSLSNRNKIINGNFDFWQRGTSGSSGYVADRWTTLLSGSTAAISRQSFTLGQTDVPDEPDYFHRTVVTSSAGAGNFAVTGQFIESVKTLAGQTATLSFWAKADASKNMAVEFAQWFGTGGSPSTQVNAIGVTTTALTTSWQKFTVTVNVPSISGKTLGTNNDDAFRVFFWLDAGSTFDSRTNTLGQQSGTFDIAQVQLEAGDVATPFEHRSFGQELALCQRYYQTYAVTSYRRYCSNVDRQPFTYAVVMRASPTTATSNVTGSGIQAFSLSSGNAANSHIEAQFTGGGTGVVDVTNATFTISAEL